MHKEQKEEEWLDIDNWHEWLQERLRGEEMEHRDLR